MSKNVEVNGLSNSRSITSPSSPSSPTMPSKTFLTVRAAQGVDGGGGGPRAQQLVQSQPRLLTASQVNCGEAASS